MTSGHRHEAELIWRALGDFPPQRGEGNWEYTRFSQRKDTPHDTTLIMAHTGSDSNLAGPGSTRHIMYTVACRKIYSDGEWDFP